MGSYAIQAAYNGSGSFSASSASAQTLTVNKVAPAVSLASSANPALLGNAITLTATLSAVAGTPTGSVSFFDGTTLLGSGTLTGSAAAYTTSSLALGSHSITAVYAGNSDFLTASSSAVEEVINQSVLATATTASSATVSFSSSAQSVTLAATVTSISGTVNAGTVTFQVLNGATLVGAAVTSSALTNGTASVSYQLPAGTAVGSYAIQAAYNGSGSFSASSASAQTLTVNKVAPAVSLASSANPALLGNAITLTATLSAVAGTPTGSVSFFDGTTLLGSGTLTGSAAAYTTSSLALGSHSITAVYAGNSDFSASTSSAIAEVVNEFTMALTSGSSGTQTVASGQAATYSFAIQAQTAPLTTPVVFSVRGLPTGATATFNPPSITPGLTASAFVMTIQTAAPSTTSSLSNVHRDLLALGLTPFMLGMLLLPFSGTVRRAAGRHGRMLSLLLLLAVGTALGGLTGCGYSNGPSGTLPQSYTITVVGTHGTTSQTTNVKLIIQ